MINCLRQIGLVHSAIPLKMSLTMSLTMLLSILTFLTTCRSNPITHHQRYLLSDTETHHDSHHGTDHDSDTDHDSHHDSDHGDVYFDLSSISDDMESIITAYDEALNSSSSEDHHDDLITTDFPLHFYVTNASDTEDGHRRLASAETTSTEDTVNAYWECETTQDLQPKFSNISSSLSDFNNNNCSHDHHHDHGHHMHAGLYIILYASFVLFIGCTVNYYGHKWHIPIPYTVVMLTVGAILEGIEVYFEQEEGNESVFADLSEGFKQVRYWIIRNTEREISYIYTFYTLLSSTMDPHLVLIVFIPGLIFESAFTTNWHVFSREVSQALILAGPGVLVNTVLVGGVMHYFAESLTAEWDEPYDWNWSFSLMFGSIASATDPVAVVALLKDLGASKKLSTLIEAESLMNDGTAFVMFLVFQKMASSGGLSAVEICIYFVQLAGGGAVFGIFAGFTCCYILSSIYNDAEIEITVTVCTVYLFNYIAEYSLDAVFNNDGLGVSGVLVVVCMGLYVSKNRETISPHIEEAMHHFWEMVGFIANTLLFFLTGQIIVYRVLSAENITVSEELPILVLVYITCHVTRGLVIWQFFPILSNIGYGCTFADSCVMWYGGLRGAIGLALALIVDSDDGFPQIHKDRVLFHISLFVLMTLVINASTIRYMVEYLGLNKPPADTASLFKAAALELMEHVHHKMSEMKLDKHYHGANWAKVDALQPEYAELFKKIFDAELIEENEDDPYCEDDELSVHSDDDQDLIINMIAVIQKKEREHRQKQAFEKRVIGVMRSSYWAQYEHGLISADAVNILVESSEDAMDQHDFTLQRAELLKWFDVPWLVRVMHKSKWTFIKRQSERLLFGSLGLAVEIHSGFVYASKSAQDFCQSLLEGHNAGAVQQKHIAFVQGQIVDELEAIHRTASDVIAVYPEVHTAIQTQHAANSLLNYQKEEIDHLLHKGFLDDAEHTRVTKCCDHALNELFHSSYTDLLDHNHDSQSIFLQSPLFSELSLDELNVVRSQAKTSDWYNKGDVIMKEGTKTGRLFVITHGAVAIWTTMGHSNNLVHTKERGEVFDVWSLLQDEEHTFKFVVKSKNCNGYWLELGLLEYLKENNINFWDTLWKCAACDAIRFYFKNENIMRGVEMTNLDSEVFRSRLGFADPNSQYKREIRINRGMGILLNGQVVHITDLSSKGYAPAVLPCSDEPYVAIEESVILYLDFDRGDYHKENTSHLNPKLAKLMGVANASVAPNDDMEMEMIYEDESVTEDDFEEEDEDEMIEREDDLDMELVEETESEVTQTASDEVNPSDSQKLLPLASGREMDFMLNGLSPSKKKLALSGTGLSASAVIKKANTLTVETPSSISNGAGGDHQKTHKRSETTGTMKPGHKKQKSNLLDIGRYRSRRQLNDAGKTDWVLALTPEMLPDDVKKEDVQKNWTVKQGFEVIKYILAEHEGLWDHVKDFHIENLQKSVKEQRKQKRSDDGDLQKVARNAPFNQPVANGSEVLFEGLRSRSNFARPTRRSKINRGSTVRAGFGSRARVSFSGLGAGGGGKGGIPAFEPQEPPKQGTLVIRTSTIDSPLDQLQPLTVTTFAGQTSNSTTKGRGSTGVRLSASNLPTFSALSKGGGSSTKSMRMGMSMTVRGANPFKARNREVSMSENRRESRGPRIINASRAHPQKLFKKC